VDEHVQINRKRFMLRCRDCVRRSSNIAIMIERCSQESCLSSFQVFYLVAHAKGTSETTSSSSPTPTIPRWYLRISI